MQLSTGKNEAEEVREKQRSESEARDIIHDVEALNTLSEEKKTRWIWELMQNANDVAKPNLETEKKEVNIVCSLTDTELVFSHDGLPFETENLTAILYKTSTKSLNSDDGNTGKYGTGFVTTHILSKKLIISGVHQNKAGVRRFDLNINRSPVELIDMKISLQSTFGEINDITLIQSTEIDNDINSFTYPISKTAYEYANNGLKELENNLPFTLLINTKIKSVTINIEGVSITYTPSIEDTPFDKIKYIGLNTSESKEILKGLLFIEKDDLIFAIPAIKLNETYRLIPIENESILFKEFPLIGTEEFNLPVFIQHKQFLPTEQRDGIRTKIYSEEGEKDNVAEQNRKALTEFISEYIPFIQKLVDANIENTHLLAKSGLPDKLTTYSNEDWYISNIQNPLRELILQNDLVSTFSGTKIKIANTKFISEDTNEKETFYQLASKLIPDVLPNETSIWHWSEIIQQETDSWGNDIILTIEDLVKLVPERIDLENEESFVWLKELYLFLEKVELIHLGENYPIYPNESNEFRIKDDVSIHPNIDNEFKIVSKGLGRDLDDEFLNKKIGNLSVIKTFDLDEFYNNLNKDLISELKIDTQEEEAIKAVFRVCSLFKTDRATKRQNWLNIITQLLPQHTVDKRLVTVDYERFHTSAQLWTIKHICYLISKAETPTLFSEIYFEGNEESCFIWLNEFLSFIVGLHEESKEVILKKAIIPTQSNTFKPYDDFIFAEEDSTYFDDTIKDLYEKYTGNQNPRNFLIDNRIDFSNIKKRGVKVLTDDIDKIFHDDDIERKVKTDGELNEMFMVLSAWYDKFPHVAHFFLPKFSERRPYLNILALGEGFSKHIMEIQSSGKTIEDIKELAQIKLSTSEMKALEVVATDLGTENLLAKAREMIDAKLQIERWKTIGNAAETAFVEALSTAEPTFEILNPDKGKDFVIIVNGKEYAIEIKSVDALKGNVNMSLLQGQTAVIEKDRYALCVISRPDDSTPVDKDYFIKEARFVTNIGSQIGSSIANWSNGLNKLDTKADVKVSLDDKTESVYISRTIWKNGIPFEQFIEELEKYFQNYK